MSKEILITVLTPTYNRAKEIINLYNSLLVQTNLRFKWLIVDDGSNDNTKEVISNFVNKTFPIAYIYKENGGKHTAHNEGIKHINTELTIIVDSDDILTNDAIQSIYDEWLPVRSKNLCGISFLKRDKEGTVSGKEYPKQRFVGNFIDVRINGDDRGEKADVWVTSILKKYPFPVFKDEKYIGEGAIWCTIAKEKEMLFINKVIYIFEYQEEGLTKSGRMLRLRNPLGGMYSAKIALSKEFNWRIKTKKMWLYICYGKLARVKLKELFFECPMKVYFIINFPFGVLLYRYWRVKYLRSH
ncbi:glycosyltransferase family 2 protein [Paenibacillus sp. IITD108]|uniref:glycosyltransferase family 2 protein n=1 Tax=Paenibacillus sp. IITD108 TaxID=3116649 RepID=UPI002F420499